MPPRPDVLHRPRRSDYSEALSTTSNCSSGLANDNHLIPIAALCPSTTLSVSVPETGREDYAGDYEGFDRGKGLECGGKLGGRRWYWEWGRGEWDDGWGVEGGEGEEEMELKGSGAGFDEQEGSETEKMLVGEENEQDDGKRVVSEEEPPRWMKEILDPKQSVDVEVLETTPDSLDTLPQSVERYVSLLQRRRSPYYHLVEFLNEGNKVRSPVSTNNSGYKDITEDEGTPDEEVGLAQLCQLGTGKIIDLPIRLKKESVDDSSVGDVAGPSGSNMVTAEEVKMLEDILTATEQHLRTCEDEDSTAVTFSEDSEREDNKSTAEADPGHHSNKHNPALPPFDSFIPKYRPNASPPKIDVTSLFENRLHLRLSCYGGALAEKVAPGLVNLLYPDEERHSRPNIWNHNSPQSDFSSKGLKFSSIDSQNEPHSNFTPAAWQRPHRILGNMLAPELFIPNKFRASRFKLEKASISGFDLEWRNCTIDELNWLQEMTSPPGKYVSDENVRLSFGTRFGWQCPEGWKAMICMMRSNKDWRNMYLGLASYGVKIDERESQLHRYRESHLKIKENLKTTISAFLKSRRAAMESKTEESNVLGPEEESQGGNVPDWRDCKKKDVHVLVKEADHHCDEADYEINCKGKDIHVVVHELSNSSDGSVDEIVFH